MILKTMTVNFKANTILTWIFIAVFGLGLPSAGLMANTNNDTVLSHTHHSSAIDLNHCSDMNHLDNHCELSSCGDMDTCQCSVALIVSNLTNCLLAPTPTNEIFLTFLSLDSFNSSIYKPPRC